jgi:hypothetical protein
MNKKFIKKNIFMLIFMFMSFVGVVALLIMVLSEYQSMQEYDKKKKELLEKIHKIVAQKYTPVMINVARINKDITGYNGEITKIQSKFGHPYALALKSFAEVVGINLNEFKEKFGKYWKDEEGRATRDLRYLRYKLRQFNEDFEKHKSGWDQAMNAFMLEAQKVTLEKIDISNVDGIFLAAMGKGRRFSDTPKNCLRFMIGMRNLMIKYFSEKKIECETTDFSFEYEREPLVEDIEKIARAWEIVADLTKRIADAKVNLKKDVLELVSFSKKGLDGEKDGNYIIYRFRFIVNGDLNTIRRIVDKLYEAYTENRVYAIRDIRLNRVADSINDILEESESIKDELDYDAKDKELKPENRQPAGGVPASYQKISGNKAGALNPRTSLKKKTVEKDKKKILGPKDRGYGDVIIGKNNICTAEFDVDYIVFDDSPNN